MLTRPPESELRENDMLPVPTYTIGVEPGTGTGRPTCVKIGLTRLAAKLTDLTVEGAPVTGEVPCVVVTVGFEPDIMTAVIPPIAGVGVVVDPATVVPLGCPATLLPARATELCNAATVSRGIRRNLNEARFA